MRSAKAQAKEFMDLEADDNEEGYYLDNLSEKEGKPKDNDFEKKQMM